MNSLKTMATAAIMVACLYGVYTLLNRTPDTSTSPEMAKEWDNMATSTELAQAGGAAPSLDISLPTTEIDSANLAELSAEQAFSSMTQAAHANPTQPANPVGVPATPAAPLGDQFSSSHDATMGSPLQPSQAGSYPSADFNSAASPTMTWQDQMQKVNKELAENRLADAHLDLSRAYHDPGTTPEKKKEIEPLLDQLAGTVVYSRQHLLEQPYKTTPHDTLETIANRFNVPTGLLAKINGLDPNAPLQPGKDLKVLQGPFSATVDLSDHALTLTTYDGRYAGRFPVGVGPNATNITRPSVYMVTDKTDTSDMAKQGRSQIGQRWIGLGEQLGLHGTNNPSVIGTSNGNGAISLNDRDVEDVYDILSIGSKVTIQP